MTCSWKSASETAVLAALATTEIVPWRAASRGTPGSRAWPTLSGVEEAIAPRMDRRSAVQRIALARVVSSTGSTAAYTALTYAIYDRTGSTTWVSVAVFVTLAAHGILMPLGGWIGDRFDRRRVMIVSDLVSAAIVYSVHVQFDHSQLVPHE